MPQISVLMPAYNTAQFIGAAIESILNQTYSDFELIIINDGSTDNTEEVIKLFSDHRIRYISNDGNKGLAYTRNRLIGLAEGNYIAFIDSDDLNSNRRLEIQARLLDSNSALGFVSASAKTLNNDKSRSGSWKFSLTPNEVRPYLLFNNPVVTSTMMIRKAALPDEYFRENYPPCEDYDLWVRINYNFQGLVLPDFLASYRLHVNNISFLKNEIVRKNISKVMSDQLEYYFKSRYTEQEKEVHISLSDFSIRANKSDLNTLFEWMKKIRLLNNELHHFDSKSLDNVLYERILKKYLRLTQYDFSVFRSLFVIRKELNPSFSLMGRIKEAVIFLYSVIHKNNNKILN